MTRVFKPEEKDGRRVIVTGKDNDIVALNPVGLEDTGIRLLLESQSIPVLCKEMVDCDLVLQCASSGLLLFSYPNFEVNSMKVNGIQRVYGENSHIPCWGDYLDNSKIVLHGDIDSRFPYPKIIHYTLENMLKRREVDGYGCVLREYPESSLRIVKGGNGVYFSHGGKVRQVSNFSGVFICKDEEDEVIYHYMIDNGYDEERVSFSIKDLLDIKSLKKKLLSRGVFFLYTSKIEDAHMMLSSFVQ